MNRRVSKDWIGFYGRHQILHFLPRDALPGLYCSLLFVFVPSDLSSVTEKFALLVRDQGTDLPIEEYSISCLQIVFSCFHSVLKVIFHLQCELPSISFVALTEHEQSLALHISKFFPVPISSHIINKQH